VRQDEVENPPLDVRKHPNLQSMEEVGLQEIAHNTGNMLNHVESLLNMVQRALPTGCLGFGIAEGSI